MTLPYTDLFLGLLGGYMGYSVWARLDSRYLIAGALGLLLVTAVIDASGATAAANGLAIFVFLLLAGGVVLLLVDHVREERRGAPVPAPTSDGRDGGPREPPSQPANERQPSP